MYNPSFSLVLPQVMAFLFAVAGVPLAKRLARRHSVMAIPGSNFRHQQPTALLGGVAIVGAFLAALALTANLPLWILISTSALMAVGVVDDILVLRPVQKLAGQIVVTLGVVLAGPRFVILNHPWLDSALVFVWLIGTTNAYNLIDGLDGLASGIGAVATVSVAATALLHHDLILAGWALALCGALFGFLVYNFPPASIFMGDAGALPVGLLLGVFVLQAGELSTNSRLTNFVFPFLVMLVPVLDTAVVSVTRLATGRPISRRNLDHIHHRLLSLGLRDRSVAVVCWAVALFAASCAVGASMVPRNYLVVALPFLLLPSALVGLFMMDLTFDSQPPGIAYGSLPRIARQILHVGYKLRVVEASLDVALVAAAYFGAFLIRLDFAISQSLVDSLVKSLPWVVVATYPAFIMAGVYRGMWRYTGLADALRFANGALAAGICVLITSWFVPLNLSGSTTPLFVILLFNLLVASRLSFRLLRKAIARLSIPATRMLIVGAGRLGAAAGKDLDGGHDRQVCVLGFVDDDVFKHGKLVAGYPVLGSLDDMDRIYWDTPFNQILIAAEHLDDQQLDLVWNFASRHNVAVRQFFLAAPATRGFAAPQGMDGPLAAAGG
jgi:UDP-GlcNAc:undecaprenyl-phosphate/decaprenyl-phosphate GlcNAc-1-phosphate transferase